MGKIIDRNDLIDIITANNVNNNEYNPSILPAETGRVICPTKQQISDFIGRPRIITFPSNCASNLLVDINQFNVTYDWEEVLVFSPFCGRHYFVEYNPVIGTAPVYSYSVPSSSSNAYIDITTRVTDTCYVGKISYDNIIVYNEDGLDVQYDDLSNADNIALCFEGKAYFTHSDAYREHIIFATSNELKANSTGSTYGYLYLKVPKNIFLLAFRYYPSGTSVPNQLNSVDLTSEDAREVNIGMSSGNFRFSLFLKDIYKNNVLIKDEALGTTVTFSDFKTYAETFNYTQPVRVYYYTGTLWQYLGGINFDQFLGNSSCDIFDLT